MLGVLSYQGRQTLPPQKLIWHVSFPIRRQEPRIRRSLAVLSLSSQGVSWEISPVGQAGIPPSSSPPRWLSLPRLPSLRIPRVSRPPNPESSPEEHG